MSLLQRATGNSGHSSVAEDDLSSPNGDTVDAPDDEQEPGPQTGASQAKHFIKDFWASLTWLVRGMTSTVGVLRMASISVQAFFGSVAVSIMTFAVILVIRSVAPNGTGSLFDELPVPELELAPMLAVILIGGSIGAYLLYRSERLASAAAVEFGDLLRHDVTRELNRPLSRGWQTALDGRPKQVLLQAIVAGVREITMAARETLRLVGPVSMFLGTGIVLFAIDPIVTLLIVPIAAIFSLPLYLVNRRMASLNESFDEAQVEASDQLAEAMEELLEQGHTERAQDLIDSARKGDNVTHARMLEPIRLRALSVVVTAFFAVVVLLLFVLRNGEELDFLRMMIYIITMRLCASAVQRIAAAITGITRRATSIHRYRTLVEDLNNYRKNRIVRLTADDFPAQIDIVDSSGNALTLRRGSTTVLLVRRPPTRATADEALIMLEHNLDAQDLTCDLLGSTSVATTEEDLLFEDYVVNGEAVDIQFPVNLSIGIDVGTAAMFGSNSINLVLTHMPAEAWDASLEDWEHLVTGVIAIADNEVKAVGSLDWARSNRKTVLASLGRI